MALFGTTFVIISFLLFWAFLGEAEYMKYRDPSQPVNVRVRDLMNRMTLAEKIGQMTQIERKVATPQVLKDYYIGLTLHPTLMICSFFSYIWMKTGGTKVR